MSSCHPRLRVSLPALRHNYQRLQHLAPQAGCAAVVKANAYGLGMLPVAQALFQSGCREFFVASLDEALELRKALPTSANILVLQGCEAGDEPAFAAAAITPVLVSLPMAQRYLKGFSRHSHPPRFALKLNTGMNRLGLEVAEFQQLLQHPNALQQAGCQWLISHLACADEPQHPLNAQQLQAFQQAVQQAKIHLPQLQASLANSAGIFLGPDYHFNWVRPGAALYGINPGFPENPMQPVASLALRVILVRSLTAGHSIGYGASYTTTDQQRIALVAGGYADGLLRAFSNQVQGEVQGHRVPLVGRVSMDSLAFDITHLPFTLQEGDWINLIALNDSADRLARAAGTIAYEIFARLGERCQREYLPLPPEAQGQWN